MGKYDFDRVVTTTAWSPGPGCHGGCGVKLYVKDDKVVRVEGDPCHPWFGGRACSRLLACTQYINHPDRILYPMKRTGPRGSGEFTRISWDEALDMVEQKWTQLKQEYGPESVIFIQGTGRDVGGPISLLCYSYGSSNWTQLGLAGQSCYTPRLCSQMSTVGEFIVADCSQFFEKRFEDPRYELPKYIVIWAQNPATGYPDGFQGHWVVDCMRRGTKLIVIDPRWNFFASRAEYFLQIRPGTDGALALGMINLIIQNDWYDHDFVENWTVGFEELKESVKDYTLDKVSKITWIPEDIIYAATKAYATNSPSAIQWGLPLDQVPEATAVGNAGSYLWCLTGTLDVPGGNVIARNAWDITQYPYSTQQLQELYGDDILDRINAKRIGADRYKYLANMRSWGQPDMAVQQMIDSNPYPIKSAWIQTSNLLGGQAADLHKHYKALMNMEFNVVVDVFHNPTTMACADLILPAATFAEKESFRAWYQPLQLIQPAVQMGEARSDWEINFALAKRFNPVLREKYPTVKDYVNERIAASGYTWETLSAAGGWKYPNPEEAPSTVPYRRYEKGYLRPDGKPGFRTPTGKVEFHPVLHDEYGIHPMPFYVEPPESEVRTPELFEKYPLIMVTGRRSPVYFHSEHRNIPWLRVCDPDPIVEIHPKVMRQLGIDNGEWVWVENDRGRIRRKVKENPSMHPGIVSVPHGWWLPETEGKGPNFFGAWDINCNLLVPTDTQSESGYGGGVYKTTLCRVRKIDPAEDLHPNDEPEWKRED
ncbi:MAG: molybdopterin-dependent oxidoreductase [Oscillospiraceae bacterium]|nr:molybdopterin-dependent oxidoreductase [Oscillospiraceae bacterium]